MSRSLAGAARHHAYANAYYNKDTDNLNHDVPISATRFITWDQNIANYGYPSLTSWRSEIIAVGRTSASGTLQQWKYSPLHNQMLTSSKVIRIGVGQATHPNSVWGDGRLKCWWVVTLGSKSHRTIYQG